jgi:conjugal transfer pilus assembly protein TraB
MFMSPQNQYNQAVERIRALLTEMTAKLNSFAKIGTESARRIQRRQFLLGGCLVVGFIALVYGIMTVLFDRGSTQTQEESPKPVPTNIATAPSQIDMNEARWNNLEISIKNLTQKVSKIDKKVFGSDQSSSHNPISTDHVENTDHSNLSQTQDTQNNPINDTSIDDTGIDNTRVDDTRAQEIESRLSFLETQRDSQQQRPLDTPYTQNPGNPEEQDGRVIQKLVISLSNKSKDLKTVETTIPAGAFAKTVLLSGLDASSAMNASSDPRPMLLRIIDHGTLPRRFQSDLKDCHCTAGAFGDLSSERVYARLEKLTCVERATGEIIETQVKGYVAGSDGKAGIRGIVASKDGQFFARSLTGGIFSGLSDVANPQNRGAQVNPFVAPGAGSPVAGPSIGENFTAGMAGGATTALDRLSQYYIDRAEQLQPVIQIAAGQVVDIVFTEGTFIGSQTIRSEIEKRDESRREDSRSQNHQLSNNERN